MNSSLYGVAHCLESYVHSVLKLNWYGRFTGWLNLHAGTSIVEANVMDKTKSVEVGGQPM